MKRLVTILALLICIAANAQSIPKDVNTIIIKGATFKEVVSRLLDNGFHIAQSDSIYQTIKTEPKVTNTNSVILVTLYARIKDSSASITGQYTVENTKDLGIMQVRNYGSNISAPKKAFVSMNNFALSLNKPIAYIKQ